VAAFFHLLSSPLPLWLRLWPLIYLPVAVERSRRREWPEWRQGGGSTSSARSRKLPSPGTCPRTT
jgi:hypothetical protein